MKEKKTAGVLTHIMLLLLASICLVPFLLAFINSFKIHSSIMKSPLSINFSAGTANYLSAWRAAEFSRTILNSLLYMSTSVLVVVFCSVPAAYVLSGKKVRGTGMVMMYFMFAMTVPVQMFLVPLYKTYARFHLLGNIPMVALILAALNLPLAITLLRTFFLGIPRELEEAATVDGANTRQIIQYVILPVISPGIVTVAIITALNTWNEFLVSSTFLLGKNNFTALLALMSINNTNMQNYGINLAATIILIAPIIVIFLLLQRKFIDGIVAGSVKG